LNVRHAGKQQKIQIKNGDCRPTADRTNADTVENNWNGVFLSARFVEKNKNKEENAVSLLISLTPSCIFSIILSVLKLSKKGCLEKA